MTHVLVIGYVWPEPNSSAAGSHMMSMLRAYRTQGWRVTFASAAQPSVHQSDLSLERIDTKTIALNCDSFDDQLTQWQPDIVVFDRFLMEEQFGWRVEEHCPSAMRILDTSDLQCLRHARHQAVKTNRDLELGDLYSDLAKREIAAILRSDLSFIISSYEMELLQTTYQVSPDLLCHVPFLVDLASHKQHDTPSFDARQHFISIGNFRHAPNWDSVLQLRTLWPDIRAQLPDVELHIYGAYPPPKATAMHNDTIGFHIKGWTDNALEAMQTHRVCLAPLRFGAGIKGKLLDAMLTHTPSVTSAIGAEAMHDHHPHWPGAIADTTQQFVEHAVELYRNATQWNDALTHIEPILSSQYDACELIPRLLTRIEKIQDTLTEHRLSNFHGAMLRHHSLKSTQYMSQWIAEKNKHSN
ncbi:MAG: glycosyltransferase [Pseudomonadota bacterium]